MPILQHLTGRGNKNTSRYRTDFMAVKVKREIQKRTELTIPDKIPFNSEKAQQRNVLFNDKETSSAKWYQL